MWTLGSIDSVQAARLSSVSKTGVRYTRAVYAGRVAVLIVAVVLTGVCAWLGPKLISSTTNSFLPPHGSQAAVANAKLADLFPSRDPEDSSFVVYVYGEVEGVNVLDERVAAFDGKLRAVVSSYAPSYCGTPCVESYESYFSLLEQGLPLSSAQSLVAGANASTIIAISVNVPFANAQAVEYAQFLQRELTTLRPDGPFGVVLIGLPAFMPLMQSSIERDMGLMDGIVFPIAMAILAYILRSGRLMVLPAANITVSALTSFAITYAVSKSLDIISFVPSLMMSILIAFNIDYQLFLLTRYTEALHAGYDAHAAVAVMISTAGHTILVSGLTLTVCFLGLVLFPLDLMISTGIGCGVAVAVTLLVNITLTPTLLLTFPKFFARCVEPFSWASTKAFWLCRQAPDRGSDLPSTLAPATPKPSALEATPLLATLKAFEGSPSVHGTPPAARGLASSSLSAIEAHEHHAFVNSTKVLRSLWYKIGTLTQTWPYNVIIIVLVVGATIPFDLHALNYTASDAIGLDLPRGSVVTDAYLAMCDAFGYGTVYPYWLLMEVDPGVDVLSPEVFSDAHKVVETLSRLPNTRAEDFNSVVYGDGFPVPYELVVECLNATLAPYNTSYCRGVRLAVDTFVSKTGPGLLIEYTPSFDPIAKFGHTWYKEARGSLNYLSRETGAMFYLSGMPADSWSAIEAAYAVFPTMIAITSSVVLVMVALAFRSILVPLRSVLSIALTLVFVYGAATLTYEYSFLAWTKIPSLASFGAVQWLPPLVVFPLIVGISLDYDIFLLVRIHEYRRTGLSTRGATIKGLTRTGGIITAAGVIMAIAFSGLLLSNVDIVGQLAFFLVFAVLFDTFVVRSFLAPSVMSLLREWNWWPGKVPEITLGELPPPLSGWNIPCRRSRDD